LLKIPHHGSASSTNADLLAVVHPKFAMISVGARNVYHHPRIEVLERLQQAGTNHLPHRHQWRQYLLPGWKYR